MALLIKKVSTVFILALFIWSWLFMACVRQPQSTKMNPRLAKENFSDTNIKIVTMKKEPLFNASVYTADTYSIVNIPPLFVKTAFIARYPTVTKVVWTQKIKSEINKADIYKASFFFNETRYWVFYSNSGQQLELRVQILPDRLPQNIYNAIKKIYAEASIISAATYKNLANRGSYVTIITPHPLEPEMELIMAEDGTFVR